MLNGIETLFRVLGRCCTESGGFEERFHVVLHGVNDWLGSLMTIGGRVRADPGKYPPELLDAHQVGKVSRKSRRALEEYFAALNESPDPAHVEAVRRLNGAPAVWRRQDLVDDEAWYSSPHMRRCRRIGVDAIMYSVVPSPIEHEYFGITTVRAADGPQFTEEERDVFGAFHRSLGWLCERWGRERDGHAAFSTLPQRLRLTLACLLEGDSEKDAARKLGLSPYTAHEYVKSLYRHLGVSSRGELFTVCMAASVRPESLRSTLRAHDPLRLARASKADPSRGAAETDSQQ